MCIMLVHIISYVVGMIIYPDGLSCDIIIRGMLGRT
jgi:hypothetical protein